MSPQNIDKLKIILETDPLWYQNFMIQDFIALFSKSGLTKTEKSFKHQIKTLLKQTNFLIGKSGYNWDRWRLPIEYAVIHHTSSAPTISLRELNILGLNLYIKQFLSDNDVKNQPVYSGHYWSNQPKITENMTFVSYHYLVRPNGKVTQLTDTSAYLWHAGNLEINRKSIGIALAGKYIDKEPTDDALKAVAEITKNNKILRENIFGHTEVINKELLGETTCPGNLFIGSWKSKLLKYT